MGLSIQGLRVPGGVACCPWQLADLWLRGLSRTRGACMAATAACVNAGMVQFLAG